MGDEGYIKFSLECRNSTPPRHSEELTELNEIRTRLFQEGLIGVLDNGIGFGNVSIRDGNGFIISGSATGGSEELSPADYARVVSVNLERNRIIFEGMINASSESMSHAAIYEANSKIGSVIHIHNKAIFGAMIAKNFPGTSEETSFGTVKIAQELKFLVQELKSTRASVVMKGHEDGVICFGETPAIAYEEIQRLSKLV